MLVTIDLRLVVFVVSLFLIVLPVLYLSFNTQMHQQRQKSTLTSLQSQPSSQSSNDILIDNSHSTQTKGKNRLDQILSNILSDPNNKTSYKHLPAMDVASSNLQLEYELSLGIRTNEYASASAIFKCLSQIPNKKLSLMGDSVSRHMQVYIFPSKYLILWNEYLNQVQRSPVQAWCQERRRQLYTLG
jgi:hypothetical protein